MSDTTWNDLEVAPRSAVMNAARQFAEAIVETDQYKEFEQAYLNFRQDEKARKAQQEFQEKQSSLKALLMLNAVSEAGQQELQTLQERFYQTPSVIRYSQAQEKLMELSRGIGELLSNAIGLDFGASCKTGGCCG